MKTFGFMTTFLCLALGAVAFQGAPKPTTADENHKWLQQFVGEWSATSEASMGPGAERTFTSSILGEDGKWNTFVRGEYHRKK